MSLERISPQDNTSPAPRAGAQLRRKGQRLGNNTESAPAAILDTDAYRRLRYDLMRTSGYVLGKAHRVHGCSCHLGKGEGGDSRDFAAVKLDGDRKAHWSGISVCGSVWTCPVCSTKVQLSRRDEVKQALRNHRKAGGSSLLATLTFRHGPRDPLADTLANFSKALSRMKASRAYKRIRDALGMVGTIRTLEITHGRNGWHPHVHEIWLMEGAPTLDQVKACEGELFDLWAKYCVRYGLGRPTRSHGVRLDVNDEDGNGDAVGSYLTKWAKELTGHMAKASSNAGRSSWAILRDLSDKWTFKDSQLWKEYADATKGRAMLYWSPGLKDALGIIDQDDQTLAEAEPKEVVDLLLVSRGEFYAVVRQKAQAQVLEAMEKLGKEGAATLVQMLFVKDNEQRAAWAAQKKARERFIQESTWRAMVRDGIRPGDRRGSWA